MTFSKAAKSIVFLSVQRNAPKKKILCILWLHVCCTCVHVCLLSIILCTILLHLLKHCFQMFVQSLRMQLVLHLFQSSRDQITSKCIHTQCLNQCSIMSIYAGRILIYSCSLFTVVVLLQFISCLYVLFTSYSPFMLLCTCKSMWPWTRVQYAECQCLLCSSSYEYIYCHAAEKTKCNLPLLRQ